MRMAAHPRRLRAVSCGAALTLTLLAALPATAEIPVCTVTGSRLLTSWYMSRRTVKPLDIRGLMRMVSPMSLRSIVWKGVTAPAEPPVFGA